MKKNLFLFAAFIGTLLLIGACSSSDSSDTDATPSTSQFTCKIAGSTFNADSATANWNGTRLIITGLGAEGKNVTLQITEDSLSVQTYSILGGNNQQFGKYTPNGILPTYSTTLANTNGSPAGTLRITSIDATNKKITGSFNFFAKNSDGSLISITEGAFTNLSYSPIVPPPPPPPAVDQLSFSVDGGATINATTVTAVLGGGFITINGSTAADSTGKSVHFLLPSTIATGSIMLDAFTPPNMQYRDNGEIFALSDTTNTVTVNVHTPATKRLKANFNTINMYSFGGTSTARHSVSGSFDVTY